MPLACDLKFYANLSSDSLFFIFYYQEVNSFDTVIIGIRGRIILLPYRIFFKNILIFLFLQGSLAQVLAARTLKSKNWRFHKQMNSWFQRLEEPKVTTTEYERVNKCPWFKFGVPLRANIGVNLFRGTTSFGTWSHGRRSKRATSRLNIAFWRTSISVDGSTRQWSVLTDCSDMCACSTHSAAHQTEQS